jgi:sugar lactone lactonase YvrE
VLPAARGGFVAGLQSGPHHFDEGSGRFTAIAPVDPHPPENRLNDATTDPSGRLWFGTMDDGERTKSGAFFRMEAGRVTPTGIAGIAITNGPAVLSRRTAALRRRHAGARDRRLRNRGRRHARRPPPLRSDRAG